MKEITVFSVFIFITLAFANKSSDDKMRSFNWLIGSWTMNTNHSAIIETWIKLNGSTIGGESILIKNTVGTEQREKLRFIYSNKEYFYCVTFLGQNDNTEVKFKITSFTDSSFISENQQHDFPKRIIYNKFTKDSIYAYVDNGSSVPPRKFDFYYSRYKN